MEDVLGKALLEKNMFVLEELAETLFLHEPRELLVNCHWFLFVKTFGAIENNGVYLFPHSRYLDLHIKFHILNIFCNRHTPIMQTLQGSTKTKWFHKFTMILLYIHKLQKAPRA